MSYSIRPTLQNCKITDLQVDSSGWGAPTYDIDQQHPTFTIKADNGYTFENNGTLTYNTDDLGGTSDMPINATHTNTVTVTLPKDINWDYQSVMDLTMSATYNPTAPAPAPATVQPTSSVPTEPTTKTYELIPSLENAKIVEPKPIVDSKGKTHYYLDQQHDTFTIQANDGYKFNSDGSLTYVKDDIADEGTLPVKASHTNVVTFTLPSTIEWQHQDSFVLTMGAVTDTIVKGTGGFINIYKADYDSLLKISNDVTIRMNGDQTLLYDYSQYINNLIILPFNVPIGQQSPVVVGSLTLSTKLPTVDNSYLTIDLGKISVAEQYQNGYDYYQVKTRLILPYTDMIEIDPIHVINKTVSIKYVINVINGDTTINLYNDDDLFFSQQVNLASEIPFTATTNTSQVVVINKLKTMFRNSIYQPYIIIEQPTPILNSDYYPTNEKGTLQGYKGNVKASLLNNLSINENDLNELQNLLQNGVNIK